MSAHWTEKDLAAVRFGELQTMQAAQLISELKVHPEFALHSPSPTGALERESPVSCQGMSGDG